MRLITLCIALATFILAGCDKTEDVPSFAAHYKGYFVRTSGSSLENPVVSNVTIDFTENKFYGTTAIKNYPAICNGSFSISQSKIKIVNNCMFTADFDWTFIFNGEYNYELSGDHLRIWRDYPDASQDLYDLRKEP